ncbi:beta-phosphoglucomutase [Bifidobacterium sp. ESL0784]|uniref:beta-phosphoglucomutase n=1 Tax=Bifidobacterium sp. ESL0784 TaxID=2983231 RepID=UPI0023F6C30E|nr:beta-phosphoglucomutase [Bifidobacterium sp. ESL0784]MDF7641215.1 beta-phosphoglucomutase [Bifidobacterium sp. ESL0784]
MKGALFDLDGVIADTAVYHFQAWRKLARDHFDRELPDELEEKTKGVSRADSLKVILDYLGVSVPQKEFDALAAEKNEAYRGLLAGLTSADILPGIPELIGQMKRHGIKLSLASASMNGPFILEKLGLSYTFDAIADPSKVAAGKPAPDIFLEAASEIGEKPEDCVGLEDSVAGITAINTAGAFSVGVGSPNELGHARLLVPNTGALKYDDIEKAWERR